MTDWMNKVDLFDLHNSADIEDALDNSQIDIEQVSKATAQKLSDIRPLRGANRHQIRQFDEIIEYFERCTDVEEYDTILEQLYDLGDENRLIWVNTMFQMRIP